MSDRFEAHESRWRPVAVAVQRIEPAVAVVVAEEVAAWSADKRVVRVLERADFGVPAVAHLKPLVDDQDPAARGVHPAAEVDPVQLAASRDLTKRQGVAGRDALIEEDVQLTFVDYPVVVVGVPASLPTASRSCSRTRYCWSQSEISAVPFVYPERTKVAISSDEHS